MKIKALFIFGFVLFCNNLMAQADTIHLEKMDQTVYRCTNPDARYWYLYKEEKTYYLVNLTIQEEKVEDWFRSYLNSQNLFYSKIFERNNTEFFRFQKPNSLEDRIIFEIIRRSPTEIVTQSATTGEEFCFKLIEF